jgi:hypothetical protein
VLSPEALSAALQKAGADKLSPAGKAYLSARILRQATEYGGPTEGNVAALRDVSFGGGGGLATFKNVDAAARAAVAVSYRACPRDWGRVSDSELAGLGNYPAFRPGASPVGSPSRIPIPKIDGVRYAPISDAVAAGAVKNEDGSWNLTAVSLGEISEWKWSYLIPGYGPYTAVKDYLGPTEEAQTTFRGLMADWEGFDRLGIGDKLFGPNDPDKSHSNLREDVREWRKFRDAWIAGSIPGNEAGGQLNVQVGVTNKIRKLLSEAKVVDPAIAQEERKGIDVEKSTTAMQKATDVETAAKSYTVLDWATRPGNKTVLPVIGAVPDKALWAIGLASVAAIVLAVYAKSVTSLIPSPEPGT